MLQIYKFIVDKKTKGRSFMPFFLFDARHNQFPLHKMVLNHY